MASLLVIAVGEIGKNWKTRQPWQTLVNASMFSEND